MGKIFSNRKQVFVLLIVIVVLPVVIFLAATGNWRFFQVDDNKVLELNDGQAYVALYDPNGKLIVTTQGGLHHNSGYPAAKIWNSETGEMLTQLETLGVPTLDAEFSPDGRYLASINGYDLLFWDSSDWNRFTVPQNSELAFVELTFGPEGKTIATRVQSGAIYIWNIFEEINDLELSQIIPVTHTQKRNSPYGLDFSKDGRFLIVVNDAEENQEAIVLWDIDKQKVFKNLEPCASLYTLVFSSDQQMVASWHTDGYVRIWDLTTEKVEPMKTIEVPSEFDRAKATLAFSMDGKLLLVGGSEPIKLWNTETWQVLGTFGPRNSTSIAFHPYEQLVLVNSWASNEESTAVYDISEYYE